MFGYMDESILVIHRVKYLVLSFIVFKSKQTENIILKEFNRTKSTLKNKKEIKYSNVRDSKIKEVILEKIKNGSHYYSFEICKISSDVDIHTHINLQIQKILEKFFLENTHVKINILYDKVSYKIHFKKIMKIFKNINNFEFGRSENYEGIQYADWIAGEAGENFQNNWQ